MIGVFDSGVGGLTVVKEIKRVLPDESILYVGDSARVPWGNKNPEIIQKYSQQICNFLVSQGISTIVIACNTASAVAGEFLRKKFPGIHFFDVIDPAVEKVCAEKFSRVAVIGTRATIGSGIYQKKIHFKKMGISVFSQECPLFVPLAEEGCTKGEIPEKIAKKYFRVFRRKNIQTMVLGCTHYPLLAPMIKKVAGKDVKIISCAREVARVLKSKLPIEKNVRRRNDQYFFSDSSTHHKRMVSQIMGIKIQIKKISFENEKPFQK